MLAAIQNQERKFGIPWKVVVMQRPRKSGFSLYDLILFTSPLGIMVAAYFVTVITVAVTSPMTAVGKNRLTLLLVFLPAIAGFIIGNVFVYKSQTGSKLVRLATLIPYSATAMFVQFFAGWATVVVIGV